MINRPCLYVWTTHLHRGGELKLLRMKFMKLGSRPDTFFTTEAIRSVSSEVCTDLQIQVQNTLYLLHKFPLLSKCSRLQRLCSELKESSEAIIIQLPDIPGGAEAFEVCAKFCYGITITLSALNIVPIRCAAEYLGMSDDIDRGNLIGKLEIFFKSCILRRWNDTLATVQNTRQYAPLCEEHGITGRCIDSISATIIANPSKASLSHSSQKTMHKGWWAEDISQLAIDCYWRVMLAVKSAGIVPDRIIGEALHVYACRWLPNISRDVHQIKQIAENSVSDPLREVTLKHRLLLERIVGLLPAEKGSLSCSFLLRLLKAANILNASSSAKMELARRVGVQLEEATVSDLLIPSLSYANKTLYDVEIVMTMLEEFMLQRQSPPTSPPRGKRSFERRRSRSAENVDFEVQDSSRRSSSASHSSKLIVAKLIDGYLQEIARDPNLQMEKLIALAEAPPDFARPNHDDLYRVIDIYLRAHPGLDKSERKQLCRILDCKKLSVEASMHAAQNELLPLRVVVRVLFFEQARAAMSGGQVSDIPSNIRAMLAKATCVNEENEESRKQNQGAAAAAAAFDDHWSIAGLKCPPSKLATLRMKLAEDENDLDDELMHHSGLLRSSSSRFRNLCSIPSKPKRILSKFLSMNRSVSERQ